MTHLEELDQAINTLNELRDKWGVLDVEILDGGNVTLWSHNQQSALVDDGPAHLAIDIARLVATVPAALAILHGGRSHADVSTGSLTGTQEGRNLYELVAAINLTLGQLA